MADAQVVAEYRERWRTRGDHYVERRFAYAADRNDLLVDAFGYRGLSRDYEPTLAQLLTHRRVLVVGEPGSGKSTVTREARTRYATDAVGTVPILVYLRSYRGNLRDVLADVPPELLDDPSLRRAYLLDGVDEIPQQYLQRFLQELQDLGQREPDTQILLTCRQTVFTQHAKEFSTDAFVFRLLDFDDADLAIVAAHQLDLANSFLEAITTAGISEELRNPLALMTVLDQYRHHGTISAIRSENLGRMIQRLIDTRPAVNPIRQFRALKILGVACEIYARNELTNDEALQLLSTAIAQTPTEALALLEELTQTSILLRTATGITFQMRSFGEYLAARELESHTVERLQELAWHNNEPSETWRNAISYLAEINHHVRAYFIVSYPTWLHAMSPAACTIEEQTQIVRSTLQHAARDKHYLVNDDNVRPAQLARFLNSTTIEELYQDLTDGSPIGQANALLLLGLRHDPRITDRALALAVETGRADELRHSALLALFHQLDPRVLETLLPHLDRNGPYYLTMADCIGTLANPSNLRTVLPVVLGTDAMLSATYYHFRSLTTAAALTAVLDYLIQNPNVFHQLRLTTYLDPIIDQLAVHWNDQTATQCATLFVTLNQAQAYPRTDGIVDSFLGALHRAPQRNIAIRQVLAHYHATATTPFSLAGSLAAFLTDDLANWLIEHHDTALIRALAPSVPPGPIRSLLGPHSGGLIPAQDIAAAQYRVEERQRTDREQARIAAEQAIITSDNDPVRVRTALWRLRSEHWPDLGPDRTRWLADMISETLVQRDLARTVQRQGNNISLPNDLDLLLSIVQHYRLRLVPDTPLIDALRAWPFPAISDHATRHGLSAQAHAAIDGILTTPPDEETLQNVLRVLHDAKQPANPTQVRAVAANALYTGSTRINALQHLSANIAEDAQITPFIDDPVLHATAFRLLVERQHRPTIERAIASLKDNELNAADAPIPRSTPLDWIASIHAPWAWDSLSSLRARALRLGRFGVSMICANTLAGIDKPRAAALVRGQAQLAPQAWQRHETALAERFELEARFSTAQAITFAEVLQRLKGSTSLLALKIWVEGPGDRPIIAALLELLNAPQLAGTIDFVSGWATLPHRDPERLLDGCREAAIIMDGDKGRELHKPRKPYTNTAKQALKQFGRTTIHFHVLERYGIEHYVPQHAYESFLNRSLGSFFPIPPAVPVDDHFLDDPSWWERLRTWIRARWGLRLPGKKRSSFFPKSVATNKQLATYLTLADMERTDLLDILRKLVARAAVLAA